ncbi:unnamed protein product [Urochloa humidicola]
MMALRIGRRRSCRSRTTRMAENDTMQYEWIEDAVVTSDQLWAANTSSRLPREVMMVPLVSVDVPNIVHFALYGWEIGSYLLVAIDSSDKQVLGSVVTYIESSEQGLSTDDADLVRAKPTSFTHFLPSEFSKFLNLNTGLDVCEGSASKDMEMFCGMEVNLQGTNGGGHQPMGQLLGGSAFDPLENCRLKKKFRMA